ncbi:MAG: hypothetical protein ACPGNV_09605 [Mangrovicoccus sp.]
MTPNTDQPAHDIKVTPELQTIMALAVEQSFGGAPPKFLELHAKRLHNGEIAICGKLSSQNMGQLPPAGVQAQFQENPDQSGMELVGISLDRHPDHLC